MAICFIMGPEARKKWSAVYRALRAECTKLPRIPRRRGGARYLVMGVFIYNEHLLVKVPVKHRVLLVQEVYVPERVLFVGRSHVELQEHLAVEQRIQLLSYGVALFGGAR